MEAISLTLIIVLFIIVLINVTTYQRFKNIYIQQLSFLNRKLSTLENVERYALVKKFDIDVEVDTKSLPNVNEKFLMNPFYNNLVKEYEERVKYFNIINRILVSIILLLTVILIFFYPDFLKGIFEH